MRPLPSRMDAIWNSGKFIGDNRPIVRLTIGQWTMRETAIEANVYRTAEFGQVFTPVELPNVQKWTWSKTTGQPVQTFQANLLNVKPYDPGIAAQLLALGMLETGQDQGSYTPGYGGISPENRQLGYTALLPSRVRNAVGQQPWQSLIVPDAMIKSYEGYGCDPTKAPEDDPNLVQTGVWLIDNVVFGTDGTIQINGRDVARLLVDTITVFPNVPGNWYPLSFSPFENVPAVTAQVPAAPGSSRLRPLHSSNLVHNGDAPEYGHTLAQAFDGDRSTYWLSVGNAHPNADYSFEYVEGTMPASTVASVTVDVVKGPYTAYVSVFANGAWQGSRVVPYNPDDPVSGPNGSNIPYVVAGSTADDGPTTFTLPTPITGATIVRVCLSNLQNFHLGPYIYRAGIRSLNFASTSTVVVSAAHMIGNYGDFTDLVKLFCAWSGFWWPRQDATYINSDGTTITENAPSDDAFLKAGRIWGDLQQTGTHNAANLPLTADLWDHKTMSDCITYIQSIIGFCFFVGDLGGVVWRTPNWHLTGNYQELDSADGSGSPHTLDTVLIDENKQLLDLAVTLSSANVRELVAVSSSNGLVGAVVQGFNPNPDGQVRIGVYSDANFGFDQNGNQECQIMAELTALAQLFTYRTDQVTIPGYPRIQIDDQVLIKERITQEYYRHYVNQIDNSVDLGSGEWTYTLTTNWLGTQPVEDWAFDFTMLTAATQEYLKTLGQAPTYGPVGG